MTILSPMSNEKTAHLLNPSARKVQETLGARGFPNEVVELPSSTRTAGRWRAGWSTTTPTSFPVW